MMSSRRWLAAWAVAASLGVTSSSWGQSVEPDADALRLSGFGTFGISRTSAPPGWGFQRESSQPLTGGGTRFDTDSRLGLQANYALDPRLELVGQLLLKRNAPSSSLGDSVGWAFAAYRPTDSTLVRAGRLSVNLYQLSDYRSVGLAYPFVRPPVEFYGLLPAAIDGLEITQSWRAGGDADWKLAAYFGQSKQISNLNVARTVRPIVGMFVSREEQGVRLKASFTHARLASGVPQAADLVAALQPLTTLPVAAVAADAASLQRFFMSGPTATYIGLGLDIDRNDWLVMAEASRAVLKGYFRLDAGYALLGHRFGAFTPYVSVSAIRRVAERDSPQWQAALTPVLGPQAAAQVQALGEAAFSAVIQVPAQRTLSVGTRYDLTPQLALKLQYDHTRINAGGSLLWANGTADSAGAHVLSTTLDFVF